MFCRRAPALIVIAIVMAIAVIAPATAGPLTENGTQPPVTYGISSSASCQFCHGNYAGTDNIEPFNTWAGSMMAQAGRDPIFWAALDVANNDLPGVGDFCLRCHAPGGWLAGRSEPPGGSVDGCGFLGPIDHPFNDFDGMNCNFCHRMTVNSTPPAGQDSMYLENGQFWIDDTNCDGTGAPCLHGPYDYPADGSGFPAHAWRHSTYHESSEMCGNCHNVTSPVNTLIENGVDTGVPYPIERTYQEWLRSEFSDALSPHHATCQNCHMPDFAGPKAYACVFKDNDHAGDLPVHELAGGNSWIPEVLRQEYPLLGIDSSFIATRNWALNMLQNHSATVELTTSDTLTAGDDLLVNVKVTNLTGHKLPTGYPEGRRMWINVQARDGNSDLVWESGAYDNLTGVLTTDPQAKVYETKPGVYNHNGTNECDCVDTLGDHIFHFVLNDCIVLDNRIPPLGFLGGSDADIQPVGYTYPETFPGSGILVNHDNTAYTVPIPPETVSPVTVTATLRYQTISKEYVEFLRDESIDNAFPADCIQRSTGSPTQTRGEILYDMWTSYDRSAPVDMTSDMAAVIIDGQVSVAGATGSAAVRPVLDSNWPNPIRADRGGTNISYFLPRREDVKLEIFSVQGRRVRTLVDGTADRGPYSVFWDGSDESGRRVPSGAYLYRLVVGGEALTKRIVVIR